MSDVTTLEGSMHPMYHEPASPESEDSQGDFRRGSQKERKSRYPGDLSPRSQEHLRLQVNARERERMHDINGAMDALRQVMPYGHGASVKKLSKMSTLLLARNYILTLSKSLEELRFCVTKVCLEQNKPVPPCGLGLMGAAPPPLGTLPVPLVPQVAPNPQRLCEQNALGTVNVMASAAARAALYRNNPPAKRPCVTTTNEAHVGYSVKRRQLSPGCTISQENHIHVDSQSQKLEKVSSTTGASVLTSKPVVTSKPTKTVSVTKCKSESSRVCFCVECLTRK